MAKIQEEMLVVKLNKLIRGDTAPAILTPELKDALLTLVEQFLEEAAPGVIPEVVDLG